MTRAAIKVALTTVPSRIITLLGQVAVDCVEDLARQAMASEMARHYVEAGRMSVKVACLAFSISQTCYRYEAKLNAENEVIADWLVRLITSQRNWGFGLCFLNFLKSSE